MNPKQIENVLTELVRPGSEDAIITVEGDADTLCPICTTPRWRVFHRPADCPFRRTPRAEDEE